MSSPIRGPNDYLDLGGWNAVCSMCGGKFKASQLIRHWQGMYRCERCWEPRQPQDFVRGVPDIQTPPWVQPRSIANVAVCTPNSITAIADWAAADCAIAEYVHPMFDPSVSA